MKTNLKLISLSVVAAIALSACGKDNTAQQTTTEPAPATAAPAATEQVAIKITGAGASFPQPIYAKWSEGFREATGGQVNYQSIGSSGGIKQIIAKTVDFGASDAPLTVEELTAENLVQFPTVIGGVVPVVNIDGIEPGALKLDGETLANIYLGKITKWNDPAITALNPDLTLPDANITTVFRSDGSGTTFNFTDYLNKVSTDWQARWAWIKPSNGQPLPQVLLVKVTKAWQAMLAVSKTQSAMLNMPTPNKMAWRMWH